MPESGWRVALPQASWIVDEGRRIVRPTGVQRATGIVRGGREGVAAVEVQPANHSSMMYEIFTTGTYAVLETDAQVATIEGPASVGQVARRFLGGDDVWVEEFLGSAEPSDHCSDLFAAPHTRYLPTSLLDQLMSELNGAAPATVPRALFSQLYWIIRKLQIDWGAPAELTIDNKSFPTEATLSPGKHDRSRVLAITSCRDLQTVEIFTETQPFYLVCNGLLVSGS